MAKLFLALIFSAAFLLVACGGKNNQTAMPADGVEVVEVVLIEEAVDDEVDYAVEEYEAELAEAEEIEVEAAYEATEE